LFIQIVDDFAIKYVSKRHADHLLLALQDTYKVTTDWTGSKFAGIDLDWDYGKCTCRLTMKGYINTLLLKYNHPRPRKPQHLPHAHRKIIYGVKEQLVPEDDANPLLDMAGVKRIQGIVSSLLYYTQAVDNKLLATLSTIGAQQAHATKNMAKAVKQLLDYVATYPPTVSHTGPVTWFWLYTPTPATSPKLIHTAAPEPTSISQRTTLFHMKTDLFSPYPKSSNASWPWQLKRNQLPSTTQHMKWYHYKTHLRKWAGRNPNRPYKPITQPPQDLYTTRHQDDLDEITLGLVP
jgi:hypothetical protein